MNNPFTPETAAERVKQAGETIRAAGLDALAEISVRLAVSKFDAVLGQTIGMVGLLAGDKGVAALLTIVSGTIDHCRAGFDQLRNPKDPS